ncbi:nucleotide sugar dehydrogenase [Synoicihabitans lomoniglobus]|uniref:UDP-glucose 6-dehydrogenase n=1 Tax=Synoicihabitans lomoniglobus TaxID=2909285 RepID=A0AAF0I294_9BACT|nr:nucleotide sugar dehydrogenase [Opitutaceae bacterium LMO-M01]WED66357.1 nucleotide sugar dehydrogenase [Opitutaceae bacterium LMO-M01]
MKICIFGLGYVGSVTAACLTERGHHVIGVDPQLEKVNAINSGRSPIVEPFLEELLAAAKSAKRLSATSDVQSAIAATDVSIVCVGTPSLESGGLDLRFVRQVCREIADALIHKDTPHLLLLRSTMLPGSTRSLLESTLKPVFEKGNLELVFCPEFLREGSAVVDFRNPSLTVLGSMDGSEVPSAASLFGECQWLAWEGAELVKYACNYWHALKVGFANEVGRVSKRIGVDGRELMKIVCSDSVLNISKYYMKPGNPFGGSCLPKDVSALNCFAAENGLILPLLDSVIPSNRAHTDQLRALVSAGGRGTVLILGLSFKKDTDDLRNSPMVALAEGLLSDGRDVKIFDPHLSARDLVGANLAQITRRMPHLTKLLVSDIAGELRIADVIVAAQPVVPLDTLRDNVGHDATVIDINGWDGLDSLPCIYKGLCW